MEDFKIKVNGEEHHVKVEETEEGKLRVYHGGEVFEIEAGENKEAAIFEKLRKKATAEEGSGVVKAPLPGTIHDVKVKKGDKVNRGDSLIKIIAMKMENDIAAPIAGIIKEIRVKKNDVVNKDDILIIIE